MALRLYMDERTYAKIERGVNKSMDIRLLSAIADILETDVSTLLQNPLTIPDQAARKEIPEPSALANHETRENNGNPQHENVTLLKEILSLKEEVKALMEFQRRAIRMLRP
jgi:transcriptional regulator with XRE-family HTH domain